MIPDSREELKKRLINRNQNTDEEVKKRFNAYKNEIKHWKDYDYIIINKNLENCFQHIEKIFLNNKEDRLFSFK